MNRQHDHNSKTNYALRTIGGIFGRADHDRFLTAIPDGQFDDLFPITVRGKNRALFETGIDALASLLIASTSFDSPIRLWTVDNFCQESLDRLAIKLDGRLNVIKYRSLEETHNIADGEVLLYLHFNRYDPTSRNFIEAVKRRSMAVVIEDFVQAPLDIARFAGDFAFNSLRKFSSLDLAVAYYQNDGQPVDKKETSYRRLRKEAEVVRSQFLSSPTVELEQRFLSLGRESEAALAIREISLAHPNEIERALAFDFKTAQRLRRVNYLRLQSQLNDQLPELNILPGDYMYLMTESRHRDRLRADLFNQRVFPVIHWVDSNCQWSRELLSLHIDQRYTPEDMDRVASVMSNVR